MLAVSQESESFPEESDIFERFLSQIIGKVFLDLCFLERNILREEESAGPPYIM